MCAGRVVRSAFRPAWWLPGAHLQTLWGTVRRRPPLHFVEERLELPDGDFVELCRSPVLDAPIVIVLHGLEGGIRSHYSAGMLAAVHDAGWRFVFMHFRGCGRDVNLLPRSYHSGDTGDIRFLVDTMAQRCTGTPLTAVGFSLGGNALLKYLGESGAATPLRAAAAVSVPFLLDNGADRLDRGLSRLYQRHLIQRLHARLRRKFGGAATPPEFMRRLPALGSFRTFDEHVTAPLHGFTGADDYYRRSSSRQYLARIRVPTLILHSRDDPFLTPEAIPRAEELSDAVTLELAERGGHVGFVGGSAPWRARYYIEQALVGFLQDRLRIMAAQ
jgi:hypothetical protein